MSHGVKVSRQAFDMSVLNLISETDAIFCFDLPRANHILFCRDYQAFSSVAIHFSHIDVKVASPYVGVFINPGQGAKFELQGQIIHIWPKDSVEIQVSSEIWEGFGFEILGL